MTLDNIIIAIFIGRDKWRKKIKCQLHVEASYSKWLSLKERFLPAYSISVKQ